MDAYELLGLPEQATAAEIKVAYRAAARRTHPDAGGEASAFAAVQAAYETLRDPHRRAELDARRARLRAQSRPTTSAPSSPPRSAPRPTTPNPPPTSPTSTASGSSTPPDPPAERRTGRLLEEALITLRLVLHFTLVALAAAAWGASRVILARLAPLPSPAWLSLSQQVFDKTAPVAVVAMLVGACWAEWRFAVVLRWRLIDPRLRGFSVALTLPLLMVGEYLVTTPGRVTLAAMWLAGGVWLVLRSRRAPGEHEGRHRR